jgi:mannose-6-phosphate isomerase-like protein (cupin superfamily)
MAKVIEQGQAPSLGLLGRTAYEIVSQHCGAQAVTLRLVEIPAASPGTSLRAPHVHHGFEECIYVLSGEGTTLTPDGAYPLNPGDAILIAAGEPHVTRNTGPVPLILLCFFPVRDIRPGTEELPSF